MDFFDNPDVANNIENIKGRLQGFIVTKDGTGRTTLSKGMDILTNSKDVAAAQYYQDTQEKLQ